MFLSTASPRLSNNKPSGSAQSKTKRSQHLLYAQQMDRVLSTIETQSPLVVMDHAIADARSRFQSLVVRVARSFAVLSAHEQASAESSPRSGHIELEEASRPELLQLYENVVHAKEVVRSAVSDEQSERRMNSPNTIMETNATFLADLQKQRADAEHARNEMLAEKHLRYVAANRVKRSYRKYRCRESLRKRAEVLRKIRATRAKRVLRVSIAPPSSLPLKKKLSIGVVAPDPSLIQAIPIHKNVQTCIVAKAPRAENRNLLFLEVCVLEAMRLSRVSLRSGRQ